MQFEQHATSISFGLLFLSKHSEDQWESDTVHQWNISHPLSQGYRKGLFGLADATLRSFWETDPLWSSSLSVIMWRNILRERLGLAPKLDRSSSPSRSDAQTPKWKRNLKNLLALSRMAFVHHHIIVLQRVGSCLVILQNSPALRNIRVMGVLTIGSMIQRLACHAYRKPATVESDRCRRFDRW